MVALPERRVDHTQINVMCCSFIFCSMEGDRESVFTRVYAHMQPDIDTAFIYIPASTSGCSNSMFARATGAQNIKLKYPRHCRREDMSVCPTFSRARLAG